MMKVIVFSRGKESYEPTLILNDYEKLCKTLLTPLYHFYQLHRQLDISRAITAESLPLHIFITTGLKPKAFGFRVQLGNH